MNTHSYKRLCTYLYTYICNDREYEEFSLIVYWIKLRCGRVLVLNLTSSESSSFIDHHRTKYKFFIFENDVVVQYSIPQQSRNHLTSRFSSHSHPSIVLYSQPIQFRSLSTTIKLEITACDHHALTHFRCHIFL